MANVLANTGVMVNPPALESFANGGQVYNADLFGGFNVSAEKVNPLFTFRKGDGSVVNSEMLTNLEEAGKIGSTMAFLVTHVGLRVVCLDPEHGPLSPAEAAAVKSLLAMASVELSYGSNKTKVGEFTGLHCVAPVDFVTETAEGTTTSTAVAANAGNCGGNFIKLSENIQIEPNLNISGVVRFAGVPTVLYTSTNENKFGFVVDLYGVKIVAA